MKKTILISLFILALVLTFSLVEAQVSQQTITYLLNGTQDAWVTQGLSAAGQTNLDLSYLDEYSGSNANDYAKTILAVISADQNPYSFNNQNLVQGLLGYHNNQQMGATNLLNDDFWGIMALKAAGEEVSSVAIQDSKNFILTNQNNDGGWGFSPGSSSDTNDTSAAIMALLDAGLTSASDPVQQAITYLQNGQNNDGGFSFYPGAESDAGSDAWGIAALYKAGINPATWQKNNNTPITHLQSLGLPDGSYRWISSDPSGNRLMTAYAAVALSEKFYPVKYYQAAPVNPAQHRLRIEGANQTYCDQMVEAANALEIVENGAESCGYTYEIEQSALGPYLVSINGETASGPEGWLYRVNWISPNAGANDYQLAEGDEVLWYFGEYTDSPLKLTLSVNQIEPNSQVTVSVLYYDSGNWLPAEEATVQAGSTTYQTNASGQASLIFSQTGTYQIYAEKNDYVRSNRENLTVGDGVSQSVNLSVNIQNPGSPGNTLSFYINSDNLNFGSLQPGQSASSSLTVTNDGTVPLHLEATVSGDGVFQDNFYLNQVIWENFSANLSANQNQNVSARLSIPVSYSGSGQKQGTLIFWATGQ